MLKSIPPALHSFTPARVASRPGMRSLHLDILLWAPEQKEPSAFVGRGAFHVSDRSCWLMGLLGFFNLAGFLSIVLSIFKAVVQGVQSQAPIYPLPFAVLRRSVSPTSQLCCSAHAKLGFLCPLSGLTLISSCNIPLCLC